ncbi:DUF4389 domain-containing protein [candidate division WOR-3 bacterium]|nr:DUF4389 domain-containing protein [candidate division WOR-3 bacterium]
MKSPVKFDLTYPESLSKGKLLLKTFFGWLYVGIPHGIVLGLYEIAAVVVLFIAWWVILFTGKFPRNMFDFIVKYYRWSLRVGAYLSFMSDIYPPFNGEEGEPVQFDIEYPETLSRGTLLLKTFLGWLYVGIPHGIILALYGIWVDILVFISWWVILFTGKYPEDMFKTVVKYIRWCLRVGVYTNLMSDVYPPFTGEKEPKGGIA